MTNRDMLFELVRARIEGTDAISENTKKELEGIDLVSLYELSCHHDLSHIVGSALDELGLLSDDEISAKFRKKVFASVFRYRGMEYELERIIDTLTEGKIAHLPLKGSVLRHYYPEAWMRTSCDIDILVKREELEEAKKLLVDKLGYRVDHTCFHDVTLYSEGGVHLELHFELIEEFAYPKVEAILKNVWDMAIPTENGYTYRMSDELFYFYHVAHMLKHFVGGGCGIRFFLDLYILDKRSDTGAPEYESLLSEGEILEFSRHASKLSKIWFCGEETDELYKSFGDMVIRGGVYGGVENRVLVQQARRGGRLAYAMSRIFLPYKVMREIFPVLKKHRWLTFLYHPVRWCRIIFGGKLRSSVRELRENASLSSEDAERASIMLDTLGVPKK